MLNFTPDYLRRVATDILAAAGTPEGVAVAVADSLVEANLTGHDSHGVIRIVEYLGKIRKGKLRPEAQPEIVRETDTTLRVDGHWGFGQVVARWTMEMAVSKAEKHNLAAAGIFNCGHVGVVGVYPAMASEHGMIALAFVNGGGTKHRVAPFGAGVPLFGTNPIAAAVPTKDGAPIVMDFSTAVVASGKIRVCRDKGELMPEGWVLDRNGRPTRDPSDYYDGGMLLTAAGHKGYGLSLLVELLGGLLTGSGVLAVPGSRYDGGNGVLLIVLNVQAFSPLEVFTDQISTLTHAIKATSPAEGHREVLLPGEPERLTRQKRLLQGIDLPPATWNSIANAARELGVDLSSR